MTKSTIPNEWLQPLVAEKVAELRTVTDGTEYEPYKGQLSITIDGTDYTREELVHIVRSYYKARDTLIFYAGITQADLQKEWKEQMPRARETLEEIENVG